MPMIEAKVTMKLPTEKRDVLKAELGKASALWENQKAIL